MIRTVLEKAGPWMLVKQQFIGVSGQVCSVTYELSGPRSARFTGLSDARAAFRRLAAKEPV